MTIDPKRIYAGIGSERTPPEICGLMTRFAISAAKRDWTLYSGHAPGADLAFEAGAPPSQRQIFLPWAGFNGARHGPDTYDMVGTGAIHVAERHHPNFRQLNEHSRRLIARDTYQVLGESCASPVKFVLCWTPDGITHHKDRTLATGGTGQAISIATTWKIPVFNLKTEQHLKSITALLNDGHSLSIWLDAFIWK